ncbi:rRNA maturation RNase YbeY [Candidatus Uhrbacteria bacterium]|nr:rRNA maturation RNase YbeY [Candidatus Uhrbacteria bacterium]
MRRTAQITIVDQRSDAQSLPAATGSASWYQSLLHSAGTCMNPFHPVPLSIVYVDPEQIRDLNKRYRGISRATDVLSFAYTGEQGTLEEGEIIICPSRALRQRHRFKTTRHQEFARLFFHGLLHIYGHDHVTSAQRRAMRSLEVCLMKASSI